MINLGFFPTIPLNPHEVVSWVSKREDAIKILLRLLKAFLLRFAREKHQKIRNLPSKSSSTSAAWISARKSAFKWFFRVISNLIISHQRTVNSNKRIDNSTRIVRTFETQLLLDYASLYWRLIVWNSVSNERNKDRSQSYRCETLGQNSGSFSCLKKFL